MIQFIVSVYNAEKSISDCLLSIHALACAKEIFVIDDSSTDRTPEILRRLASEVPFDCCFFSESRRSKARAVNHAYRRGTAQFVCVTDADVIFDRDRFEDLCRMVEHVDLLALTENKEQEELCGVSFEKLVVPRNSFIVRRGIVKECILDETYTLCGGEDLDLVIRFLKSGFRVGSTYGGYKHLRSSLSMGVRRRLHFHKANIKTYLKHCDTRFARKQMIAIASSLPERLLGSLRQEFSVQKSPVPDRSSNAYDDEAEGINGGTKSDK